MAKKDTNQPIAPSMQAFDPTRGDGLVRARATVRIPPPGAAEFQKIAVESSNLREDETNRVDLDEGATGRPVSSILDDRRPYLILLAGLDMGQMVEIPPEGLRIGRGGDQVVQLQDDGVSRIHVEVTVEPDGALLVTDLDSTNGTFVNGKRISKARIPPDARIVLGRNTVLKYVLQDDVDHRFHSEMFKSTTRDGLTGVFNRKYLMQKLASDISFARRHEIPFSLLILDVDRFKRVNDSFGHQAGDQVLISIANVVMGSIRMEDTFGRYGGEEFVVIAPGTPPSGAYVLAERIRRRVEDEPALAIDGRGFPIRATISVGVVTLAQGTSADAEALIAIADENLYRAKSDGRNRTVSSEFVGVAKRAR